MTKKQKRNLRNFIPPVLLIFSGILLILNEYQIIILSQKLDLENNFMKIVYAKIKSEKTPQELAGELFSKGVPEVYGEELKVNFDDPVGGLKVLKALDPGTKATEFEEIKKQRYISIGQKTACEYCCAAKTLVTDSGKPACSCAHSAGMRGLTSYLLDKHSDWTDDQILTEVNKWKSLWFPKQTLQKAIKEGKADASVLNQMPSMVGGC